MDVSGPEHQGGGAEADAGGDERGGDRSRVKQVGMVAHLAQLHQNVDDTHEVAGGQCLLGCGLRHEVVIETALALGQPAADDMLILLRHLLLNVHLHSAEQERPQNLVEALDETFIVLLAALNHAG